MFYANTNGGAVFVYLFFSQPCVAESKRRWKTDIGSKSPFEVPTWARFFLSASEDRFGATTVVTTDGSELVQEMEGGSW